MCITTLETSISDFKKILVHKWYMSYDSIFSYHFKAADHIELFTAKIICPLQFTTVLQCVVYLFKITNIEKKLLVLKLQWFTYF